MTVKVGLPEHLEKGNESNLIYFYFLSQTIKRRGARDARLWCRKSPEGRGKSLCQHKSKWVPLSNQRMIR